MAKPQDSSFSKSSVAYIPGLGKLWKGSCKNPSGDRVVLPINEMNEPLLNGQPKSGHSVDEQYKDGPPKTEPSESDLEKELEASRLKNDDLFRLVQQQDEECRDLYYQKQRLVRANSSMDSQIKTLTDHKECVERELVELKETSSNYYRELQTCKDDLFRLQPAVHSTDSDIIGLYESLCQQVSNWVDSEISQFEDQIPTSKHWGQAIVPGDNANVKTLLDQAPGAGEYLLMTIIHAHIQSLLFGKDVLLFGLEPSLAKSLKTIEDTMAELEPPKDDATIRAWRSDTLQAIEKIPDFISGRKDLVDDLAKSIFGLVFSIFPGLQPGSLMRFHQGVLISAVELEAKIHTSSTDYYFSGMDTSIVQYLPCSRDFLTSRVGVDVETRRTIKPDTQLKADSRGVIGLPLLNIEPSLVRGDNTVLRRSKYVLKLCHSLPKQAKRSE